MAPVLGYTSFPHLGHGVVQCFFLLLFVIEYNAIKITIPTIAYKESSLINYFNHVPLNPPRSINTKKREDC